MTSEEFAQLAEEVVRALRAVSKNDWAVTASGLDWSCWQTVDHMIDCLFSFTFQVAAQSTSGFLPFGELHARTEATPDDLLTGLEAMVTMLTCVLDAAPEEIKASDGLVSLGIADWRDRAGFELGLHTFDVCQSFDVRFELAEELSKLLIGCPSLWMLDRQTARSHEHAWHGLLAGSGRERWSN